MSTNKPDTRLDTIASCIGHGIQVQTTRTPRHFQGGENGAYFPASGMYLAIFSAADTDEGRTIPAESARLYVTPADTDKLIAVLQEHRARMEPEPVAVNVTQVVGTGGAT
jgi:hypothetical protein